MTQEQRNENLVIDFVSGMTYQEIGKRYDITRERVRQIIRNKIGSSLQKKIKYENITKRKIERALNKPVNRCCDCGKAIENTSIRCRACFKKTRPRKPLEEIKAIRDAYYARPDIKERVRAYQKTEKYLKYHREYHKRPEVRERDRIRKSDPARKEKERIRAKEYYHNVIKLNPRVKEARRKWEREYNKRQEVKLRRKKAYENRKLKRQNNNS